MSGSPSPLTPLLERQGFVLLDGGLATALERRGHDLGDALWSARLLVDDPQAIRSAHSGYLAAGADCITTAAYQATVAGFERLGLDRGAARAALRRSTELARAAVDEVHVGAAGDPDASGGPERWRGRPLVAASVGPYGAWLADGSEYDGRYGRTVEELRDFHRERFALLARSGADLLACETIPSALEAEALLSLLEGTPGAWAWLSFSCADDRTLHDGSPIEDVAAACGRVRRVAAVGVNCTEPRWIGGLVERIRSATDLPVAIYPNSGERWDGRTKRWLPAPVEAGGVGWLEGVRAGWLAGARVLGGCCRTGPEEIRELRTCIRRGDFPA